MGCVGSKEKNPAPEEPKWDPAAAAAKRKAELALRLATSKDAESSTGGAVHSQGHQPQTLPQSSTDE